MKNRLGIFALALALIIATSVSAGDAGNSSLFAVGAGARALGMGGAFTSLADDATAVYYNPACLPHLEFHEVSFMHMQLFEGTVYDFASWAHPLLGLGGVGIAYMRIGTSDIVRRSNFVNEGWFDFSTSQLLVSAGRELEGGVTAGVTLKVINQSLDNLTDNGFGMDLGLRIDLTDRISTGLIVRDIVPAAIKLKNETEHFPTSVTAGLSLRKIHLSDMINVTGSVDLEKSEGRSALVHAGAEMVAKGRYSLRAGYDRDNFSLGIGYAVRRLRVDYAYKFIDYLPDSHRFSLSFMIGSSISEQRAGREAEARLQSTALLEDEKERQFAFFKDKADVYNEQFRLDSALAYYYRALAFDEDNQEVIGTIAAVKDALEVQQQHGYRLTQTRTEMAGLIDNFFLQARIFADNQHYSAALDMIGLILDIETAHTEALLLQRTVTKARTAEIDQQMENGRLAESEGRYFDAIEAYASASELDPGNAEIAAARQRIGADIDLAQQLNTGIELYRVGQYDAAEKRFRAVLAVDLREPVALEYMRKIDLRKARPVTLDDLQEDKTMWSLYLEGLRHMRNKDYQAAIAAWEKVLQTYPNSESTLSNIEQARLRLESETGQQ